MDPRPLWRVTIKHRDTEPYMTMRAEPLSDAAHAAAVHEFLLRTNANTLRIDSVLCEAWTEARRDA